MREEILSLLNGQKTQTVPAFSGLIHVTADGLVNNGLTLYETHHDAQKLATAAASTFRLTGMPSAALPLDLCAPAEALGAQLNYYRDSEYQFPQPARSLFASTKYLNDDFFHDVDFISKGRLPLILEAFRRLKDDIGDKAVISGIIPGPYTLLLYLIDPAGLFTEMKREPNLVQDALFQLSSFLSQAGSSYRNAGADLITVHEMGGSPGFIGPSKFEQFVFPAVKQLVAGLPKPTVVSVCGNVNKSLHLLNEMGANAISIDQTTDMHVARETLKDTLLFGNLDPVALLWQGNTDQTTESVRAAKEAGLDAVWPGCDLVPQTPIENLKAFLSAAH